jgi:hypothetical protein
MVVLEAAALLVAASAVLELVDREITAEPELARQAEPRAAQVAAAARARLVEMLPAAQVERAVLVRLHLSLVLLSLTQVVAAADHPQVLDHMQAEQVVVGLALVSVAWLASMEPRTRAAAVVVVELRLVSATLTEVRAVPVS